MRSGPWFAIALAIGLLGLATLVPGCGKRTEEDDGDGPKIGKAAAPIERKSFEGTYDGTLKGKVILDGDMPDFKMLAPLAANKDCHAPKQDENVDQKWIVDNNKGVRYAVVWLMPPKGTYFKLPEDLRTRKDPVVIDQPHCAFIPHVVSAFPQYFDSNSKKYQDTGEQFIVKNSARIQHNTKWAGKNKAGNPTLSPGDQLVLTIDPNDKIQLQCSIHSWMYAFAFTFEHPFHAVSKQDGTFEIKNVPTGVDLTVVGWHDGADYFLGGKKGQVINIPAGQTLDMGEVKAKRKS
jgi:hypothetical protein